jgi:uncharacterized protein (DUF305 family)
MPAALTFPRWEASESGPPPRQEKVAATSVFEESTDMKTIASLAVALVLFAGAGVALGQHAGHAMPEASTQAAASTRDFQAADAAMMKAMQIPYTGNPDIDFRAHMIPHHQGAIAMAEVALKYAADESTRVLARQIIADQTREMAEMRAWLAANAGK